MAVTVQPIVSVPGRKALRQTARWLRSRGRQRVAILGYHRIADVADDPFRMAISPGEFDRQLAFLARACRPVSLAQALEELDTGRVAPATVAVTLDDGYGDTLEAALPVLRRHGVPATVFVCSGNAGQPFWWDRLASLAREGANAALAPTVVEVDAVRYSLPDDPPARLARLAQLLEPAVPLTRERVLGQLGVPDESSSGRALRDDELTLLAGDPLIEIGAHTVTHRPLALLPEDEQRREITENLAVLASLTGRPVRYLAYPHGSVSTRTERIVRQAGLVAACCSAPDVALPGGNRFALPRLWPEAGLRFRKSILHWVG